MCIYIYIYTYIYIYIFAVACQFDRPGLDPEAKVSLLLLSLIIFISMNLIYARLHRTGPRKMNARQRPIRTARKVGGVRPEPALMFEGEIPRKKGQTPNFSTWGFLLRELLRCKMAMQPIYLSLCYSPRPSCGCFTGVSPRSGELHLSRVWSWPGAGQQKVDPIIPQKRLRTQEETPRKQGDTMCFIVFDVCYRHAFFEYVLRVCFWVWSPFWEMYGCVGFRV